MINLCDLKALAKPEKIAITEHARKRLVERKISVSDIIHCISKGEIIEQYEDDKPFSSCLVSGEIENGEVIHSVVSHDEEYLYLITAYHPDTTKWESDFRTRKE